MTVMHKMHPHVPNNTQTAWCFRHVLRSRLAAFDDGVTCKSCLEKMRSDAEYRADFDARKAQERIAASPEPIMALLLRSFDAGVQELNDPANADSILRSVAKDN